MSKSHISIILASTLGLSVSLSAEVTPFGFLGAYYYQGLNNMPAFTSNNKSTQAAYSAIVGNLGVDIGLSNTLNFGLGLWGAFPVYQNYLYSNKGTPVGKKHYWQNYDVSDIYLKYDDKAVSVIAGRFDVGRFYLDNSKNTGKKGSSKGAQAYSGLDWLYGHIQGAAFNVNARNFGIWGLWMNSKLGVYGNQNRMSYEMAHFNTFSSYKNTHPGEVFMGGIDLDYDTFKFSPFLMYDTNYRWFNYQQRNAKTILSAGMKAVLSVQGSKGIDSNTTLRVLWQKYEINKQAQNSLILWIDEEVIISNIFKVGAGYIKTGKHRTLLYGHDNSRFYGYRGNGWYGTNPFSYYGNAGIWYIFGGIKPDSKLELDLLYAGGSYSELSVVAQFRIYGENNGTNVKIGGGFVSSRASLKDIENNGIDFNKRRNNIIAFVKASF
ncbi:hypothetical protein [Helicobacter sp. 10-6591]|uniref:hypothetical protein n=1 Tax=Helicobacter sp. 10-6591 TaxID=2004998 RepID=UPI000DCEAF4E|nr:hypothetical protein [Helicobacter sp. 10-6591]RAX53099.1 hypothetical protein CCY97_07155 [Helicobacter sp. 10-6591]